MLDYSELAAVPPEQRDEIFWARWLQGTNFQRAIQDCHGNTHIVTVGGSN